MTKRYLILCTGLLMLLMTSVSHADFDFDELEQLESAGQTELLELASEQARDWNFSKAETLLEEAEQKGYAPDEIKEVTQLIASNQQAYKEEQERKRREEEARKREHREEARKRREEEQRLAQQRARSGSGGGAGSLIMVRAECIGFACVIEDLQLHSRPGNVQRNIHNSSFIMNYGSGMAGTYSYSVRLSTGNRVCSGSFYTDGNSSNIVINVYESCDSYITTY